MLDLVHKILYTGIGFATLTEQKARELVSELENRGEVSSEEGKKLAQELIDKAHQQSDDFRKAVSQEVEKISNKFKWVSKKDYEALEQKIADLEGRLAGHEGSGHCHEESSSDDSL